MQPIFDPFIQSLLVYTIASVILIRFCYYQFNQNRSHAAAFLLFGAGVFLVTSQLHSADVSMGFAFGLFAVFSMLRYRTESMNIKDMTYLFLTIAMALLCAVSDMPLPKLAAICGFICLLAYVLEKNIVFPLHQEITITYEKIDLLHPDHRSSLLADLTERTGLNIHHVEVLYMDFMRDSAQLKLHYKQDEAIEDGPNLESLDKHKLDNNLDNDLVSNKAGS